VRAGSPVGLWLEQCDAEASFLGFLQRPQHPPRSIASELPVLHDELPALCEWVLAVLQRRLRRPSYEFALLLDPAFSEPHRSMRFAAFRQLKTLPV